MTEEDEPQLTLAEQLERESVEFCLACNRHVRTFFSAMTKTIAENVASKSLRITPAPVLRARQTTTHPWGTA
jgi:ribosomal protein L9